MTDFAATRALFDLPDGLIYLDGNSLGPLPRGAAAAVARTVQEEWGGMLISAWNRAGWMEAPARLGDRIGRLIGAAPGTVSLGDTLTVKVVQALSAALPLRPDRRVILTDSGNFPSDIYAATRLAEALNQGHEVRVVAPEAVAGALDDSVAVLMLTEVDYRTGRRHDMAALTARAHDAGALTLWDLAHSAGAVPVDLAGCGADFAAGCTYKFLNGGPGAPAFVYVAPEHAATARPAMVGWLGHAAPFDFAADHVAAPGAQGFRIGTPPVVQMAALSAALDIWDGVDMAALHARAAALSDRLIAGVEAACPTLTLASPRDPDARGSQVSFRHPEGYAIMQALIAHGVIGDFRAPDILRFGITPLYVGEAEVDGAVAVLSRIMDGALWDREEYRVRHGVT